MRNLILLTTLFICVSSLTALGQKSATYNEVLSKQKKGRIDKYITQKGEEFNIGDTITLGVAFRNELFDYIKQKTGIAAADPLPNTAANSKVVIKKINIHMKTVFVWTTKPQGFSYGLLVTNFDSAIQNGEIKSKIMSSDEALTELKKWKEKFDLELISADDYKKKKEELSKFIK
jgi:hypothetical protein